MGPKNCGQLWSFNTGGLLRQVNYSENCTLGTLKGWSLNTGGLRDKFDCIPFIMA